MTRASSIRLRVKRVSANHREESRDEDRVSTCSGLDDQMVGEGSHGKRAAGRCIGLERLTDRITDEFLHCLFQDLVINDPEWTSRPA
jgi:hypothetical protein